MATRPKRYSLGYSIFTTSELKEKKYLTKEVIIDGAFIKFEPQLEIMKGKKPTKLHGTKVILPESVIREIIFQEIDETKMPEAPLER